MDYAYIFFLWLSYSLLGQLKQTDKPFRDERARLYHGIVIRFGSYGVSWLTVILVGSELVHFSILTVLALFVHIVFVTPDLIDFYLWRKLLYKEKPYGVPKDISWIVSHNGFHHYGIEFFSTGKINTGIATGAGLVRSGVAGLIFLIAVLNLI